MDPPFQGCFTKHSNNLVVKSKNTKLQEYKWKRLHTTKETQYCKSSLLQ